MFQGVEEELAGYQPGSVKIIIFGGVAVHLYTNHRVSVDVDGEMFYCNRAIDKQALIESLGATPETFIDPSTGRVLSLNYDLTFNTTLGPLHEDYLDRAIPLEAFSSMSALHILIAAPVDLAISKLGRATDQDLEDIETLLTHGLVSTVELERLALQAIDVYVGNKESPRSILRGIIGNWETTHEESLS
jgi:hypothetical protein